MPSKVAPWRIRSETETGCVHSHLEQGIALGFLSEFLNVSIAISAHQAKSLGLLGINGKGCHGEVGTRSTMVLNKLPIIHPVELIPREDEVFINIPLLK